LVEDAFEPMLRDPVITLLEALNYSTPFACDLISTRFCRPDAVGTSIPYSGTWLLLCVIKEVTERQFTAKCDLQNDETTEEQNYSSRSLRALLTALVRD